MCLYLAALLVTGLQISGIVKHANVVNPEAEHRDHDGI